MKRCLPRLIPLVLMALALAGCRSTPSDGVLPDDATDGWTLLVRAAGPRWLDSDWWRAQGLDPETLDPDTIGLHRAGVPVPFLWLDSDDGPGLLFLGAVESGRFGPAGGYHLTVGDAGVHRPADATVIESPSDFQMTTSATLWLEVNNTYRPTAPDGSNWLWTSFNSNPTLTLTIPLTSVAGAATDVAAPATLSLYLWGQSNMAQNPDHHIRVLWNGDVVDDHFWDGNAAETWDVTVPVAQSGDNELLLVSPGDTEAPVEVNWLDKIGVTWQRTLTFGDAGWDTWSADATPAACWDLATQSPATQSPILQSPVAVLLAEADGAVRAAVVEETDAGRLCIGQQVGDRGWIGVPEAAPPPDVVRARAVVTEAALLDAEYMIVAPRAFHIALEPLVAVREADGLGVAVVTPEQLYDAYGSGVPDAEALRRAVLALQADGELRYLLLVGDASANPDAVWEPGAAVVPTGWVRTAFVGDTPSDYALVADAGGVEAAARVAVGRFPAASVADVAAMVAKTLAWQPNARLLLLNDDSAEFVQMADALAEVQTPELRLDAGDEDVRRALLRWLRDGQGMLAYTGHGSLPVLGDEKFLTVEDAGAWDGPTVVVAWTCLCAGFTHPQQSGLSEAWLRDPQGTVAVVGPTGETTTGDQSALALAFHRALADGATLGDALLSGWGASQSLDARVSFLLLGDPALRPVPVP